MHVPVTEARMDIDPDGFVEQAADKLGVLKLRVQGDMQRFKKVHRATGGETGAWRGDLRRPGSVN